MLLRTLVLKTIVNGELFLCGLIQVLSSNMFHPISTFVLAQLGRAIFYIWLQ